LTYNKDSRIDTDLDSDGLFHELQCIQLEIKILLTQKQVVGIVEGTKEVLDEKNLMDAIEFKAWKKQHRITWVTILLGMERSSQ